MPTTKVAIPVFGLHISPRFDCAAEMLFVEFEGGKIVSRRTTIMEGMNSLQRISSISTSGATLLVCGALTGFYRRMLDSYGIQIIHAEGMTIDALLERIIKGEFISTKPCGKRGIGERRRVGCPRAGSGAMESLLNPENPKKGE